MVVSQYADPRYGLALLDQGSDRRAYLLKDRLRDREHLIAAVYAVAAGGSVVDAKVVEALIARAHGDERLAAAGTDAARARDPRPHGAGQEQPGDRRRLFLSKRAVEKHINSIFMKLGLAQRRGRQPARQGRADLPRGSERRGARVGLIRFG